jgi:hypothetical protein
MACRPLTRTLAFFLGTLLAFSAGSTTARASETGDTREMARLLVSTLPVDSPTAPTAAEIAKIRIWIAFSLDSLPVIAKIGVKNLFETGTSSASANLANRRAIENGTFGKVLPTELADFRPKYAFLLHEDARPVKVMDQYGSVFLEVSPSVYDRTTFSYGDSLDTGSSMRPLAKHPVEATRVRALYSGFGYAEAQVWGTLEIDEIDSIVVPRDLGPRALENLLALAGVSGFGVKTYEPGALKALDVGELKTLVQARPGKPEFRRRLSLSELRNLYGEQNTVAAKSAVLSEIGLYSEKETGSLLDAVLAEEKKTLAEMRSRLPAVARTEFVPLNRKILAYETLFVQIAATRNRRTRIRNSATRLAQDPKANSALRAAAERVAKAFAGPTEGVDPEHLLWRSQRGEIWNTQERRAIEEAFQAGDWRTYGIAPSTETTRGFVREFDRQIPHWWREDLLFKTFLEKADWELEYYADEWIKKWRAEDPIWRLHLRRILEERMTKLKSENLTGAVYRAASELVSRMDREFPRDCPKTLLPATPI